MPDPCASITGKPPISDPEPTIGGIVTLVPTQVVSEATMELFRCVSGSGVSQGTVQTNLSGTYLFSDLAPAEWYYVKALMIGPLLGKSPASGTSNPSATAGLGDSVTNLNFAFQ